MTSHWLVPFLGPYKRLTTNYQISLCTNHCDKHKIHNILFIHSAFRILPEPLGEFAVIQSSALQFQTSPPLSFTKAVPFIFQHLYDVDAIIITILQMDKLRLREAKELAKFTLLVIRTTETWAQHVRLQSRSSYPIWYWVCQGISGVFLGIMNNLYKEICKCGKGKQRLPWNGHCSLK